MISMNCKSTDELNHEIKNATNIEDYLSDNKTALLAGTLSEHLNLLLSQKGLKKADVLHGSQLGKAYIYQIFSGQKFPSRDKLIAIAFGLHLSESETQKLLKLSGYRELYARDERDAIILFTLQRDKTIFDANELLFNRELAILDTSKESFFSSR